MDSTATTITRYAYISAINTSSSDNITYGGGTAGTGVAANTSDGTALDASKPMRIFIPMRAGHIARVKNPLVDVNGDHLITEISYDEGEGTSFTSISSIGENDSVAPFKSNIFSASIEGMTSYGNSLIFCFSNFYISTILFIRCCCCHLKSSR